MRKDKSALPRQRKEVRLDAVGIDVLSQLLVEALQQADVDRKDIIRLRLAVEEILGLWQADAAQKMVGVFRCGTRLGRMYIEISAPGRRIDPEQAAGDIAGQMLCANLLAQAGLAPTFSYHDGVNRLAIYPARPQKISPLLQLLLAICGCAASCFARTCGGGGGRRGGSFVYRADGHFADPGWPHDLFQRLLGDRQYW